MCATRVLARPTWRMIAWGRETFGDPCRACGFDWATPEADARALVDDAWQRYVRLIGEADGRDRHPALEWTAGGYVCHVADSLRVWAERVANVALGDPGPVAEYNQNELAAARSYDTIGVRGALWSLQRAVGDWRAALELVDRDEFVMTHRELGTMTALDVILIRAHDVNHHAWDIGRSMEHAS
jgi:DinB family protein